jgi:hypothetical protein
VRFERRDGVLGRVRFTGPTGTICWVSVQPSALSSFEYVAPSTRMPSRVVSPSPSTTSPNAFLATEMRVAPSMSAAAIEPLTSRTSSTLGGSPVSSARAGDAPKSADITINPEDTTMDSLLWITSQDHKACGGTAPHGSGAGNRTIG